MNFDIEREWFERKAAHEADLVIGAVKRGNGMADHERIWLEPKGAPDRCWCQDNQWGDEGVEYVRATEIEALRRENQELRADCQRKDKLLTAAVDDYNDALRERDEARQIVRDIHWMARRYADGRNTYAPTMFNDAVKIAFCAGWLNAPDDEPAYAVGGSAQLDRPRIKPAERREG
jgi:hypothetical protein